MPFPSLSGHVSVYTAVGRAQHPLFYKRDHRDDSLLLGARNTPRRHQVLLRTRLVYAPKEVGLTLDSGTGGRTNTPTVLHDGQMSIAVSPSGVNEIHLQVKLGQK